MAVLVRTESADKMEQTGRTQRKETKINKYYISITANFVIITVNHPSLTAIRASNFSAFSNFIG